jgi:hypothetical protein
METEKTEPFRRWAGLGWETHESHFYLSFSFREIGDSRASFLVVLGRSTVSLVTPWDLPPSALQQVSTF